jgi:hypothetical protein
MSTHRVKPKPNSLAILRTCQQIYLETKDIWLKLVLFDFTDMQLLLDKLPPLPLPILSQIRRARLNSLSLLLYPSGYDNYFYYFITHAFALVPGLELGVLEVDTTHDSHMHSLIYDTVSSLIERSNGRRELRVFIPHSRAPGYKSKPDVFGNEKYEYRRQPQPDSWSRILRKRDGQNSRSEVKIYRARKLGAAPGAIYGPSMRESFSQDGSETQADSTFGVEEDAFLLSEQEAGKEMLIVAKRPDAVIVEDTKRQDARKYDGCDIRQLAAIMMWAESKRSLYWFPEDGDSYE